MEAKREIEVKAETNLPKSAVLYCIILSATVRVAASFPGLFHLLFAFSNTQKQMSHYHVLY